MMKEYEIVLYTAMKCDEAKRIAGAYISGAFKQGFDVTTITLSVEAESLRQATQKALDLGEFLAGLFVVIHRIEVGG